MILPKFTQAGSVGVESDLKFMLLQLHPFAGRGALLADVGGRQSKVQVTNDPET